MLERNRSAISLQNELRKKIILKDCFKEIKTIAGADIALAENGKIGFAGVIVYTFPELVEIERVWCKGRITFPYVPGLLSFREAPLLLKAFARLKTRPDVIMIDGQGIAHPRRFGIASHIGLLLDIPSIGCAKSRLIGEYEEPPQKEGSFTYLYSSSGTLLNREVIGIVLRTRDNVRPVFISPGHKISLKSAAYLVLKASSGFRIPMPTREADIFVKELSKS